MASAMLQLLSTEHTDFIYGGWVTPHGLDSG
jgi:hypothetical protein